LAKNFSDKVAKARLQALRFLQGRPLARRHIIAKKSGFCGLLFFAADMRTAPKGANFLWVNRTLRTRGKFYGKLKKTVGQKLFFYLSYLY